MLIESKAYPALAALSRAWRENAGLESGELSAVLTEAEAAQTARDVDRLVEESRRQVERASQEQLGEVIVTVLRRISTALNLIGAVATIPFIGLAGPLVFFLEYLLHRLILWVIAAATDSSGPIRRSQATLSAIRDTLDRAASRSSGRDADRLDDAVRRVDAALDELEDRRSYVDSGERTRQSGLNRYF